MEDTPRRYVWLEDYAFDTFLNETEYLDTLKTLVAEHPYLPSDQWKDVRVAVNTPAFTTVSYTHLDVYKRQVLYFLGSVDEYRKY